MSPCYTPGAQASHQNDEEPEADDEGDEAWRKSTSQTPANWACLSFPQNAGFLLVFL